MASPNIEELLVTTLFNQAGMFADAVTDNVALYNELKEGGYTEKKSGGYELRYPIKYAENSTGRWVDGYETLDTTPQDVMTALVFRWKMCTEQISISKQEELMNSGSLEQLFDLLAERTDNAKDSMVNLIDTALNSDGTADSGKQLGGLQYLFPTSNSTGTIGGISRASWPFVRHQQRTTLTALGQARSSANIKGEINIMMNACVRGADKIGMILSDDTDYNFILEALQAQQIMTNARMAEAGFENIKYRGATWVLNGGQGGNNPAGQIYGINTKTLRLVSHRQCDFTPMDPDRHSFNQMAMIKIIAFMGNLICKNPKLNFNLN